MRELIVFEYDKARPQEVHEGSERTKERDGRKSQRGVLAWLT